jgi:hypothetical protein
LDDFMRLEHIGDTGATAEPAINSPIATHRRREGRRACALSGSPSLGCPTSSCLD